MSGFEALLRLQDHDTRLDQLAHKLATLPERAAVDANRLAQAVLAEQGAPVHARRDELSREQKRLEDEVAGVEAKAAEVHHRLYESGITSPKELQALQQDHDALKRRQNELEDRIIEVMEAAEPIDAELAGLEARREALESERRNLEVALTEAAGAVERERDEALDQRGALVADVPPEQLATYDRLRPQFGGIAVARLVGTQCSGCHLSLSAVALEEVRHLPPGAVATCEECGRMLVR